MEEEGEEEVAEEAEEEEDEKHSEPVCPWEVARTAATFVALRPPCRCYSNEEPLLLLLLLLDIPRLRGKEKSRPPAPPTPPSEQFFPPSLFSLF